MLFGKTPKSTLWGTPRQVPKIAQKALRGALSGPGPKSTPVNGGPDRKISAQSAFEVASPPPSFHRREEIGAANGGLRDGGLRKSEDI